MLDGVLVSGTLPLSNWVLRTALEASPNTVIETAFHALCLDSGSLQQVKDFMRDLLTADIGVLFLVIVVGETIEAAISRLANVPRELEDLGS
jgi:hypothetical protein